MASFPPFRRLLSAVGSVAGAFRPAGNWISDALLYRTVRDWKRIYRLLPQEKLHRGQCHEHWNGGISNGALMSEQASRAGRGMLIQQCAAKPSSSVLRHHAWPGSLGTVTAIRRDLPSFSNLPSTIPPSPPDVLMRMCDSAR
jgi:hypothetical protein